MSETLIYILVFVFIGSIVSLFGGVILLAKRSLADKLSHLLAAFAAGALLGAAFLDLLPEALEEVEDSATVLLWTLGGMLIFFYLERIVHWFHHHQRAHEDKDWRPTVPLLILGDSIHNFVDGVVIAATFLISVPLGIVTALAVAAHEIPQEIGEFGVFLSKGLARKRIIFLNLLSSLFALVGALGAYFILESVEKFIPVLLGLTAGFFIYIAATDLIPEIHHKKLKGIAIPESLLLLAGVCSIWLFVKLLEG